jgi:DNA-binding CsgD family transcriptional regulator
VFQIYGVERWLDITKQHLLQYGVADALSVHAMDAEGRFLVVIGASLRKMASPTSADNASWGRIASHVAAASRLRNRLLVQPTEADGEAVVTPSGAIEHAEGEAIGRTARDVLREAVLLREKALAGGTKSDPDGALRMWRGLVEGRWSLVDRFERDGGRYIVAHANDINAPGPRVLSAQERTVVAMAAQGQPLKLVAYDLGLSAAAVSAALRTGMAKVGASSRAELTRIFATLHGHPSEDRT